MRHNSFTPSHHTINTLRFFILSCLIFSCSIAQAKTLALAEAIAAGKITAQFESTGRGSGGSVLVTVTRTSNAGRETLNLSIARGTCLRSLNEAYSDVVVQCVGGYPIGTQPKDKIILTDAKPAKYVLFVYSTNINKASAPISAHYVIDKKDHALSSIIRYAELTDEATHVIHSPYAAGTESTRQQRTSVFQTQNSGNGASERRLFFPDGGFQPPVRKVSYSSSYLGTYQ